MEYSNYYKTYITKPDSVHEIGGMNVSHCQNLRSIKLSKVYANSATAASPASFSTNNVEDEHQQTFEETIKKLKLKIQSRSAEKCSSNSFIEKSSRHSFKQPNKYKNQQSEYDFHD